MPTWPPSLPQQPLVDGLQETLPDVALRTQMDAGADKVRRRHTAAVRPLTVAFLLDGAQSETLDAFYADNAALPFDWEHPRTGAAISLRFVGPPRFTAHGSSRWRAELSLEVLP